MQVYEQILIYFALKILSENPRKSENSTVFLYTISWFLQFWPEKKQRQQKKEQQQKNEWKQTESKKKKTKR